jgi:S-DNA-T family DNA segregation ATPase FtsK/SpoIIIE
MSVEDSVTATVTDINTRRPVRPAGEDEKSERATGARRAVAFVRAAGIHGKKAATHPVTKGIARQGAYVGIGAKQSAKRWREARTTARYDRMLRLAEAAGNHEQLATWEEKRAKFVKERHDRRMAMLAAPYHIARATVITSGVTVGGLLAIGIALGIANKNVHDVFAPLMDLIEAIRFCVGVFDTVWQPALLASPWLALAALWHVGRTHSYTGSGWMRARKADAEVGAVVTADGIVKALQHLGIGPLNAAFKDGWMPTFHTTPIKEGKGYRAIFDLPLGVTPDMVADQREKFARNLYRSAVEVWPTDAKKANTGPAGYLDLWVADAGALDKPAPAYPLLGDGTADVFEGVPGGVTPRGDALLIPVYGNNFAVGGNMGQGKSNACRVVAAGCALDPLCEIRVYVFAGNGDFDAYRPRLAVYERGATDAVAEAGLYGLMNLYNEVGRREERLAELGAKKLTRSIAEKHADLRPIVALFSECHELFGHEDFGKDAADYAVQTLRRARKTGITLGFDTQSSRKEAIPPKIVELVTVNACFSVKSWRSNDGFLGDGSFAAGIRATELRPGVDRGRSLITGVSESAFELLKWYFIEVNDDTGYDAATEIIARAMAVIATGTKTAGSSGPEIERRDLLADIAEVIGSQPKVLTLDVVAGLKKLAPTFYKKLSQTALSDGLKRAGAPTQKTDGGRMFVVRERVLDAINLRRDDDEDAAG